MDARARVINAKGREFSVEELGDRVSLLEPRIVLLREIPDGTPATLDFFGERILALAPRTGRYGIVKDLTDAREGDITEEYRKYIPTFFKLLAEASPGLCHVATVFGANPLARVLARFMFARLGLDATLHKSREHAASAVRSCL